MPINPEDYVFSSNPWFETKIQYDGLGHADFENPRGWIEGPTRVSFDEAGHSSIEMDIKDFSCEETLETKFSQHDTLLWLLNGRKPYMEGEWAMHLGGVEPRNTCSKLKVTSEHGIYETLGEIHYGEPMLNFESKVYFFPLQSKFETLAKNEAKYWVMPLLNLVASELTIIPFPLNRHILDEHPLRVYRIASISQNLPLNEQQEALHYANGWNCFIAFKFGGSLGFIERLLDYEERSKKLLSGEAEMRITSVMVGDIGNQPIDFDQAFQWIPIEFLHMLSLASGSLVGTPWIEFRDGTGTLHSRIHTSQWGSRFSKGHEALDFVPQGGISWLLSNAPMKLDANLRTAIRLTVKGSQSAYYLDDQLAYLFRAADTLTKTYRTRTTIPISPQLDEVRKKKIEAILKEAKDKIYEIAEETEEEEKAEIKRIAQVLISAMSRAPKKLGDAQALLELLKDCGLHDSEVIPDVRKWIDRFKEYRSRVIHESYFELSTNRHSPDEFIPLTHHLRDILLRILLKKLNYTGYYKRAIPIMDRVSVDWVQSNTTPEELGYK